MVSFPPGMNITASLTIDTAYRLEVVAKVAATKILRCSHDASVHSERAETNGGNL